MSDHIITEENVWNYYIKLPNCTALCKFCPEVYPYLSLEHFQLHLKNIDHIECIKSIIKRKRETETLEIYFNRFHSKCYICGAGVLYHEFRKHVKHWHGEQDTLVIDYEIQLNTKEYWQPLNDFTGKCKLCKSDDIFSYFMPAKLNDHIISHLKKSTIITSENKLWDFYTKLENFQVKCNMCHVFRSDYISTTNFIEHVRDEHAEIFSYEEENRGDWPWMYYKYNAKYTSKCLLCFDIYSSTLFDYVKLHMDYSHPPETLDQERYNCNWAWKYLKKNDNNEMKCNVSNCSFKMPFQLVQLSHFERHIRTHLGNVIQVGDIKITHINQSSRSQP